MTITDLTELTDNGSWAATGVSATPWDSFNAEVPAGAFDSRYIGSGQPIELFWQVTVVTAVQDTLDVSFVSASAVTLDADVETLFTWPQIADASAIAAGTRYVGVLPPQAAAPQRYYGFVRTVGATLTALAVRAGMLPANESWYAYADGRNLYS